MRATKNQPRAGNRRLSTSRQRKQQHLLDVKVRARRASHHRNRRILLFLSKIALVIALCAGAYYGVRTGLSRFFFDNPDYRLSTIAVRTDGTLQRDQVLQAGGLSQGLNIFAVNLAQVHDRLQQLPQIDEVQVERKMPNEIDITITERKPIAWITSEKAVADPFASEAAFLVDARGILMKEKKLLPEYLALPLITGCSSEALVPGKTVDSFEAKSALELLRLTTTSFMQTRFQIRDVDVSKGYCLLVTDKNHTQVMFGFDDLGAADAAPRAVPRLQRRHAAPDRDRQPARLAQHPGHIRAARLGGDLGTRAGTGNDPTNRRRKNPYRHRKGAKRTAKEPEIRKATAIRPTTVKKALPYSPGVKKFHSSPAPLPVRRAVPLQRFNQEGNGNG